MLKKAASGVLASLPCSRTGSTLRAPNWLRPCWTDFFDHSRRLLISVSFGVFMGHVRNIQQAKIVDYSENIEEWKLNDYNYYISF